MWELRDDEWMEIEQGRNGVLKLNRIRFALAILIAIEIDKCSEAPSNPSYLTMKSNSDIIPRYSEPDGLDIRLQRGYEWLNFRGIRKMYRNAIER